MAKKSAVRTVLTLDCECGKYSYHTEKNKRNTEGRLELKKFCPSCRERKTLRKRDSNWLHNHQNSRAKVLPR